MLPTAREGHGVASADRAQRRSELGRRVERLGAHILAGSAMRFRCKSTRTYESRGAGDEHIAALEVGTRRFQHTGNTAVRRGPWTSCQRPDEAKVLMTDLPAAKALAVQHVRLSASREDQGERRRPTCVVEQ